MPCRLLYWLSPTILGIWRTSNWHGGRVAMLQRVRFDCSFLAILLAFTLTTLGLGGCTSGSRLALSSLKVTPANASVTEGSQQQFTATGTFSDGSTQDLTKNVRWSSSDNSAVTIDSSGL